MPSPDPRSRLTGCTLAAVFAHPDDESLACGGTLARAAAEGARVVVICVSHGEAGAPRGSTPADRNDLGRVRVGELNAAARVLGISEIVVLDHADGYLRWADFGQEIALTLTRYHADAVITFDEDGLYWHPDHIGVYEQTTAAVQSLGAAAPPLYYVTIPSGTMPAVVEAAADTPGAPAGLSLWGLAADAFGHSANPPSFAIDVRDWVPQKLAALRCHRTQIGADNPLAWIGDDNARRLLGHEYFRRAPFEGPPVLESLAADATGHAGDQTAGPARSRT